MIQAVIAVSPFRQDRKILSLEPGASIAEILISAGLPENIPARIFINDLLIKDDERSTSIPNDDDLVAIRILPKAAAVAALLIAMSTPLIGATAAGSMFAAGSLGMSIVSGVMSGAIGLVGNLILKALIPPPSPPKPNISSWPASYTISGQSNQMSPYAPLSRLFGTRLVYPALAAQAYTEIQGNDQYLRMVLTCGYGPVDMRHFKIAQTNIEHFQNIEWEIRNGYPDDAPLTLYSNDVFEQQLNVKLLDTSDKRTIPEAATTLQTGDNCDEISIDITHPQGLQTINNVGNHRQLWVDWRLAYAKAGTSVWTYLDEFGRPTSSSAVIRDIGVTGAIVRKSVRWRVPRGRYSVKVVVVAIAWLPNRSLVDTFFGTTFWTALRTIRYVDPIPMKSVSKIALRIRASNQLSGVISQLSCVASSILRDYDSVAGRWDNYPGSWDTDWFNWGGYPRISLDQNHVYQSGGKSLAISTPTLYDGCKAASNAISVLGWKNHELTVSGHLSASATVTGIMVEVIFGGDDHFQYNVWSNWIGNRAFKVGDRITPTVNNPGPLPLCGGYTYRCVVAGTTAGGAPTFNQDVGSYTPDGTLMWENIGGPMRHSVTIFNGTVGTGWTAFSQKVVVPYPFPDEYDPFVTYFPGDTCSSAAGNYLCINQCQNVPPTTPSNWVPLSAAVQNYCDYMRVVITTNQPGAGATGRTLYCDKFEVIMNGVNILPNGSFDYPGRITSNPASHYREVLQGSANKRAVTDSRIDIVALQAWHTYAAANGYMHNGIMDRPSTVFETLRAIAAAGRAGFFQRDDLYSVVLDKPQSTPVQHFTPRNSWNFRSTKAFPDLPQALRVRFVNILKNYQVDEVVVYDDGYDQSNTTKLELLDESNVVAAAAYDFSVPAGKGSQPWRDGRYHLLQARLRPETYQFHADLESIVCTRGDLIYVQHDVPQWGLGSGRITAWTGSGGIVTTVTTDEVFYGDGVHQCVLRVRTVIGGSRVMNVGVVPASGAKTFNVAGLKINDSRLTDVGLLVMFGFLQAESALLLVTAVEPQADLAAIIYAQDYSPAIYTGEQATQPSFVSSVSGKKSSIIKPLISGVRSDESVMVRDTQRSYN